MKMAPAKTLDEVNLIAALLLDVSMTHEDVFNYTSCKNTFQQVSRQVESEGLEFLTQTLPRYGKHLDRCLSGQALMWATALGVKPQDGSELPVLMGEFLNRVFDSSGSLLPEPCVPSVAVLRQFYFLFYKYELPYTADQERAVVLQFVNTEDELKLVEPDLREIEVELDELPTATRRGKYPRSMVEVAREARIYLQRLFRSFDVRDIMPCHGPGVVATKQRLWAKYEFTNVSNTITSTYPLDEYFYASLSHVADEYESFSRTSEKSLPARVLLVPKDSRGPRLISCEPVDFQWVQGGLRKALVEHVEGHFESRRNVLFTNQEVNRQYALLGSVDGSYSTLDLKEASDRVSIQLVHLLWPEPLRSALFCCRSQSTVLPNGEELTLRKFAPMGSSLCFPVMALTIYALLRAAAGSQHIYNDVFVYGDDVIVPRCFTRDAIDTLEAFGLRVNSDKCCTSGLFRESCGLDAFAGIEVTPIRLRTVWSPSRSPDSYSSWISYANSFYDRGYYRTYEYIVGRLHAVYGAIPADDMQLACPSLRDVSAEMRPRRTRTHQDYQKRQFWVWDVKTQRIEYEDLGWRMLLRFFIEAQTPPIFEANQARLDPDLRSNALMRRLNLKEAFSVRSYTRRGSSMLVRRWR